MKKYVCPICGYVHEGNEPPEKCPLCGVPGEKFLVQEAERVWADEHKVGIAKDLDPEVVEGLRQNFSGECSEVGMYLAMSRQADREGYPEVAEAYKRIALEEAEHAAWTRSSARPRASLRSPRKRKSSVMTRCTIPCTRCARTRPVTAKRSRVC